MGQNITWEEWEAVMADLAVGVGLRWPGAKVVTSQYQMAVSTPSCSGTLGLEISPHRSEGCHAHVYVGSGTALIGDTREVEAGVARYRLVLDILHHLYAETVHIQVHEKGSCPCDACCGRGTASSSKKSPLCERCDGAGVR